VAACGGLGRYCPVNRCDGYCSGCCVWLLVVAEAVFVLVIAIMSAAVAVGYYSFCPSNCCADYCFGHCGGCGLWLFWWLLQFLSF
jgi:hypothetical protein